MCRIDGCGAPAFARGWCRKHYARWWRHGDTNYLGNGGERNGQWKGDAATATSGRERAARRFPLGICECEGCETPARDRHHKDGNPLNNAPENVARLCRKHHMLEDGRLAALIDRNEHGRRGRGGWLVSG